MSDSVLKEFEPFFGGDQKGPCMVQAMYLGTDYTKPAVDSSLMCELLKACNFKNHQSTRSSTGQNQGPNDVHQDVTDLVINTALFHRSVDESSTAGSSVGSVLDKLRGAMKLKLASAVSNDALTTTYNHLANGSLSDYYVTLITNTVATNQPYDAVFRDHVVACNQQNCIGNFLETPEIQSALSSLEGLNRTMDIHVIDNIQTEMKNTLVRLANQIRAELRQRNPTVRVADASVVKAYLSADGGAVKQNLVKVLNAGLDGAVVTAVRNTVNVNVNIRRTTLSNDVAKSFVDVVFGKWAELNSDVRNFYLQNVALFAKVGSGLYDASVRKQSDVSDWVHLSTDDVDKLFASGRALGDNERANLRVNLLKNPSTGMKDVLFGSNLPDVPSGSNVWYSQQNGTGVVPTPSTDFLRQLYQTVYSNGVAGNVVVGSSTLDNVAATRSKAPFALDPSKFVSSVLKRDSTSTEDHTKQLSAPVVTGDATGYPILSAFDNVYGKLWSYDSSKGQYYRVDEGNRRVYYDESAVGDASTCYSTYLAKGNSEGCKRVIQCIIDGNSQTLSRCLDTLGNVDLWAVASDDVQKVDPDMIRLFLRKFGVQAYEDIDHNGVRYKIPMSFEEWKTVVVDKFDDKLKATILDNTKLLSYIRGLLGVCRANPSILNKNNVNIISRDTTPEYISNLQMRKYKVPASSKKSQYQFFADSLQNALQTPDSNPSAVLTPLLRGNFSNVTFFSPANVQAPVMFGGNHNLALDQSERILKNGSSSMFSNLLSSISVSLAESGIQLHAEDQARLKNSVKQLETHEQALAKISTLLVSLVKLARFYGTSLEGVDRDHFRTLRISDLRTPDDVRDYVRRCAKDCSQTIMSNMHAQQAVANELLKRIAPRLIREGCTDASKAVVKVASSTPSREYTSF